MWYWIVAIVLVGIIYSILTQPEVESDVILPEQEGYKHYSYHESTYTGERDGIVYKKQRIEEHKD